MSQTFPVRDVLNYPKVSQNKQKTRIISAKKIHMAELHLKSNPIHTVYKLHAYSCSILKTSCNGILTKKKTSQALMTAAHCTNAALMSADAEIVTPLSCCKLILAQKET